MQRVSDLPRVNNSWVMEQDENTGIPQLGDVTRRGVCGMQYFPNFGGPESTPLFLPRAFPGTQGLWNI